MPADLAGLLRIDRSSAVPVIKMLTRAFWKYPVLTHFFPHEAHRQGVSESILAAPVYTCIHYGEIYATSEKLEGAAVWTDSADYPANFWRMLHSVPLRYIFGLGTSGAFRMYALDRYINDVHKRLVPYSHHYLEILGVDPQYQGQGFSSKLIKPMLVRLDTEGKPCYLETQDEKDVAIYLHFGFTVIDESVIPDTPLHSWAMLRKPQRR